MSWINITKPKIFWLIFLKYNFFDLVKLVNAKHNLLQQAEPLFKINDNSDTYSLLNFHQVNKRAKVRNIIKFKLLPSQQTFTCSKSIIEAREKGVKYVQS